MSYTLISKKNLPDSILELEISLPWTEIAPYEKEVLAHFKSHLELPGFRKGNVPEAMVKQKLGEKALLEEMAEHALGKAYSDLVGKEKIQGIGRPQVVLQKLARDNEVIARITIAVIPEISLPDYIKIARGVKKEEAAIAPEEVEKFIQDIRHNYAKATHSYGENHNHEGEHRDEDLVLPELNDEFVQKLGQFKDLPDFRTKLEENLLKEKEMKNRDRRRNQIADALIDQTEVNVPAILVESELERMWGRMEADIERAGLKVADYLKHINKSKEDIRGEWKNDARKRAALQIIVIEIAKIENLKPDEKLVKENYDAILTRNPEADPMRAKLYIEEILVNEAVFEFLEKQA